MILRRKDRIEVVDLVTLAIQTMLGFDLSGGGTEFRQAAGRLLSDVNASITSKSLGTDIYNVFEQARLAGIDLATMDKVRDEMRESTPVYAYGVSVRGSLLMFYVIEHARIVGATQFKSSLDVDAMIARCAGVYDDMKLELSNVISAEDYRNLVAVTASVMQHLSATERRLPQIVHYSLNANLPSLVLAQLFYADASRSEEIIRQNSAIHPAFIQRDIRALSR